MSSKSNKELVAAYRRKIKTMAIIYKGGECIICGYSRYHSALDFHHINPENKNFQISSGNTYAWSTVKDELDKCVLLCKNCHSELHGENIHIENYLRRDPDRETGEALLEEQGFDPYLSRDNKNQPEKKCEDCGVDVSKRANRCRSCAGKNCKDTKIQWPSVHQLIEQVKEKSFMEMARQLGVSDNAIRNRIEKYSDIEPSSLV